MVRNDDQDRVDAVCGKLGIIGRSKDRSDIFQTGFLGHPSQPIDHFLLDIHRENLPRRSHVLGSAERKEPWSCADIRDHVPFFDSENLQEFLGFFGFDALRPVEPPRLLWIRQLDLPAVLQRNRLRRARQRETGQK